MVKSAQRLRESDYGYDARSQTKRSPNGCCGCCCCCKSGLRKKPLPEMSGKRQSNNNLKRKSCCMGSHEEVPLLNSKRRLSNVDYPKLTSSVGSKDRKFVEDHEYMTFLNMLTKDEDDEGMVDDGVEEIDVDEELDPQYKSFFENLKEDGKSYVLDMKRMKGTSSVYIKYEEDGESSLPELKKDVGTNLCNISGGKRKRDITDEEDLRPESLNQVCFENPPNVGNGSGERSKRDLTNDENLRPESLNQVHSESPPRSFSPELGPMDGSHPFLDELKHGITCEVDESYSVFLSHVRIRGESLVMQSNDGIVPYGEYNECPSDSELPAREDIPHFEGPELKPSSPLNSYDSHTDEDDQEATENQKGVVLSEFEKKLQKCLKVPYNEKEFEEKYREATNRKLQERHRDLRGRSVSYSTETRSRSYLDHHSDLANLIDVALKRRDVTRALSLLRCLFFYYENLSHEESFVPWTDPSFLKHILGPDYW